MDRARRRRVLLAAALPPAASGHAAAAASNRSLLCFLAVGDWGAARPGVRRVAKAMAEQGAACAAGFVVSLGDHFYHHGVSDPASPRFASVFDAQFPAEELPVPWFMTLGNHDWNWIPKPHRGYARVPDLQRAMAQVQRSSRDSRWRLPDLGWTHDAALPGGGVLRLVLLDTVTLHCCLSGLAAGCGARGEAHRAWAEAAVATAPAVDWLVVAGHFAVLSSGPHAYPAFAAWLLGLMERTGAAAYLHGDNHYLQVTRMPLAQAEALFVTSGAGMGTSKLHRPRRPEPGVVPGENARYFRSGGFAQVTADASELTVTLFPTDGRAAPFSQTLRHERPRRRQPPAPAPAAEPPADWLLYPLAGLALAAAAACAAHRRCRAGPPAAPRPHHHHRAAR